MVTENTTLPIGEKVKLTDRIRWIKAELGVMVRGLTVMFDLINACSFRCPSCPVGNLPSRKGAMMSLDMFRRMMDRIQLQTHVRQVLLYAFSEPFLHPQIAEFVKEIKSRGIEVMISTNLSRTEKLEDVLAAGLDELRISFSGFDQGEYFHTGRDMEQFIAACDHLSERARWYSTKIGLIFHIYQTNEYELSRVRQFAKQRGFNLIKETAFFIPNETIVEKSYTEADEQLISHLKKHPNDHVREMDREELCYYQQKQIVIDAEGRVILCRSVYKDEFVVGHIMTDSLEDIRRRMRRHTFCVKCKDNRLNVYKP